jgi:hypothetical protein
MDDGSDGSSEARFAAYVEQLGTALGDADRQEPLHDYCLAEMRLSAVSTSSAQLCVLE